VQTSRSVSRILSHGVSDLRRHPRKRSDLRVYRWLRWL